MLKEHLISTTIQRTLAFFCGRPDRSCHERELARLAGISFGAAHRALTLLEAEGALTSERIGRMVFYRLDESHFLVRQYKILTLVTGLEPLIHELGESAARIILYGSSATGEYLEKSDVDLLIVTSHPDKATESLFKFGREYYKEIRPVIVRLDELMAFEKSDPVFYNEVNKGIVLYRKDRYE